MGGFNTKNDPHDNGYKSLYRYVKLSHLQNSWIDQITCLSNYPLWNLIISRDGK